MEISFTAVLWEWQGKGAWCFVTVPTEYYDDIKLIAGTTKRGFGSLRVAVTVGETVWHTSIFPDSSTKSYLLPVKKEIRTTEGISISDSVAVRLKFVDV